MTTRGFVSVVLMLIAVYSLNQPVAGLVGGSLAGVASIIQQLPFGRVYNVLLVGLPGVVLLAVYGLIQWGDF